MFLAAVAGAALALAGCAGVPLPREQLSQPGALLFNGYTKPDVDCYICHNGDGRGARGPNLAPKVPRLSDEKIATVIRKGSGFMPKFGGKLTDEEVEQLTAWLKSQFP